MARRKSKIMSLDIIGYLESTGIDIKYSGENVGGNDVAISCPFCDDPSYHLTIHCSKGYLNCWRCEFDEYKAKHKNGWVPNFKALIKEIEKCSWRRAKEIWEDIGGDINEYNEYKKQPYIEKPKACKLPQEALPFDNPGKLTGARDFAFNYLQQRGFTKYHIQKYKLYFCPSGYYQHRIIIPLYKNDKIVNWIGRRYVDHVHARYLNCKLDKCVIRWANTLYGVDHWSGDVIRLVEGAFDKMRIGDSALALNRSQFSRAQRDIVVQISKQAKYVSLLLDPEAEHRAISIAESLCAFVHKIKIVALPIGFDPASMAFDDIMDIERQTPFYTF